MRRSAQLWRGWGVAMGLAGLALAGAPIRAGTPPAPPPPVASYADLATLLDSTPLVLKLVAKKQAVVEPERSAGLAVGRVRLYVEAEPQGVLLGPPVLPPLIRYLVDLPLDAKGHPPELKKKPVLVFARPVAGDQTQLQLVAADAQLPWDADLEARARAILAELARPDAPGHVRGVREAMFVPGALVGEGETQIFLDTAEGTPASITVVHGNGRPVRWSVSFSEVVDAAGTPPQGDTLAWYRLACSLPEALPDEANVSQAAEDKAQAANDYRLVRAGLGPCTRLRPLGVPVPAPAPLPAGSTAKGK